ncbi:dihydropteroate synthase [bacterium]|nr:dihydropteroate synthase [bacterium]
MSPVPDYPTALRLRETTLDLSLRCHVMGILNVTPDSFSDGGQHAGTAAVEHALRMVEEGADIVDIGGESTRPGAREVPLDEELARVLPVVEAVRSHSSVPISVDTRKAAVAEAALEAGADVINDISAMRDDADMPRVAAAQDLPVVLMHMQGSPEIMQRGPRYENVVEEVLTFFRERLAFCHERGIRQVVLDPGIGFGKTLQHNLDLLRAIPRFAELGCPVLIGTSRKSFLGQLTGREVDDRLAGSIASNLAACRKGARLLRVHDVRDMRAALDVTDAIDHGVEAAHAL